MNKFFKLIASIVFAIIFVVTLTSDSFAEGVLDGAQFVNVLPAQDTATITYRIDNPGLAIQSGPVSLFIRSIDGRVSIPCSTTFDHDASDGTSSFNQDVPATCDLSSRTSGTFDIIVQEGAFNRATISSFDYTFGQPPPYEGTIQGRRLTNGNYEFTVYAGTQPFALETEANIYIEGTSTFPITAPWNGGTNYSCNPSRVTLNRGSPTQATVICSILNIPAGTYNVHLLRGRSFDADDADKILGSDSITIRDIEITRITRAVSGDNQNEFDVTVTKYSGPTATYTLKVDGSDIPSYPRSFAVGTHTLRGLNFNMLTPGQWPAYLVDEDGTEFRKNGDVIVVTGGGANNSCSCQILSPGPVCGADPQWTVTNNCSVGATPAPVCINPDPTQGLYVPTCECACSGTPTVNAPGAPGTMVPEFDADDLGSFFRLLQNVIIAIAVLSGVFIIPYAFVLMASGNPEKIKQGTDWLKSIFWGYLVIFLSGALIRFVGGEILSLGV